MQKLMKNRKLVVIWEFILHYASIYDKTLSVAIRRNVSLVLSTAIKVMVIPRLSAVKVTLVPHVTTTEISKLITRNIHFII